MMKTLAITLACLCLFATGCAGANGYGVRADSAAALSSGDTTAVAASYRSSGGKKDHKA